MSAPVPARAASAPTSSGLGAPVEEAPRRGWSSIVRRLFRPRAVLLDTRRPVEVPVLTEVKRLWQRGERTAAVRYGYASVLADLSRAFGVTFPSDWTHEDILERGVTEEMVPIPEFLHRFLNLYAPVRYGARPPADLPSPEPLLQSIYAHPKMWGLYLYEVPVAAAPPGPGPAAPRGTPP